MASTLALLGPLHRLTDQLEILSFSASPQYISPENQDGENDASVISFGLGDSLPYKVDVLSPAGAVIKTLGEGTGENVSLSWDGRDNQGFVEDGVYKVRVSTPEEGLEEGAFAAVPRTKDIIVDNTSPEALLTHPPSNAQLTQNGTYAVEGTASDTNFESFEVKLISPSGEENTFLTGDKPVSEGQLGWWTVEGFDSMPDGQYTIVLTVKDKAKNPAGIHPLGCGAAVNGSATLPVLPRAVERLRFTGSVFQSGHRLSIRHPRRGLFVWTSPSRSGVDHWLGEHWNKFHWWLWILCRRAKF